MVFVGYFVIVILLLRVKVDKEILFYFWGWIVFYFVVFCGWVGVLWIFFKVGVNENVFDMDFCILLYVVVMEGYIRVVLILF